MQKKILLPLGLVLITLFPILSVAAPPTSAQWTFMIYVCADNDLESSWAPNLQELEGVGSTSDVHFVALVDLKSTSTVELIHIDRGGYTLIETWAEQDMGDPAVAINFVSRVKALYPANKYLIDFWDHGNGWDYFCWDQTSDDWLDVPKLGQIMDAVGFIDIVGFDACDMAQAEVYYEFVGHSSYVVGSEETIPLIGWPYDTNAQDLVNNPGQAASTYAVEMVTNYGELYRSLKGYGAETFSAVNIAQIPALTTAFTDWTSAMLANLGGYKRKYASALSGTVKMWATYNYVDMYDYMVQLQKESVPASLVQASENVKAAISSAVVANWYGKKQSGSIHGLTFYWAKSNYWTGSQSVRANYLLVPWGQVTGWINFLDAYHA